MATVEISIDHDDPRIDQSSDEAEPCCAEHEVELAYEPGDSNYGADADGNRGISVPGYFYVEDEMPTKCEECGHEYTQDERNRLQDEANRKADEYEVDVDPGYPEPDYYED